MRFGHHFLWGKLLPRRVSVKFFLSNSNLIPLAIIFLVFLDDVLLSIVTKTLKLARELFITAPYVDNPASFRLLSNHKIKPSFATIDKCVYLVFSSITSRHVSASTCGHLQVISVTQNIKIRGLYSLQRICWVEWLILGKVAVVNVKIAK
jgi:hypothetical protein